MKVAGCFQYRGTGHGDEQQGGREEQRAGLRRRLEEGGDAAGHGAWPPGPGQAGDGAEYAGAGRAAAAVARAARAMARAASRRSPVTAAACSSAHRSMV